MVSATSITGARETIHKTSSQFKRLSFLGHRKGPSYPIHRHVDDQIAKATTRSLREDLTGTIRNEGESVDDCEELVAKLQGQFQRRDYVGDGGSSRD